VGAVDERNPAPLGMIEMHIYHNSSTSTSCRISSMKMMEFLKRLTLPEGKPKRFGHLAEMQSRWQSS